MNEVFRNHVAAEPHMSLDYIVITLPDSGRLQKFQQQDSRNLFKVLSARNVRDIRSDFDLQTAERHYRRVPREGEIGCTLSHFQLQKNVSTDWRCIVEDDAILGDRFFAVVNQIAGLQLPPTVVILGQARTLGRDDWFIRWKQPLKNRRVLTHGLMLGEKPYINTFGTVGYMLNRAASGLFSSGPVKPYWLADDWNFLQKIHHFQVLHLNRLVVHEDLKDYSSTTGNKLILRCNIRARPFFEISGMIYRRVQYLFGKL